MNASVSCPQFIVMSPPSYLATYINHYWLSLNNEDASHVTLPDGAIDIVIKVNETSARSWVYGTTTQSTAIALEQRCHYLGIRFKPGQSRHFLHAAASDLTDRCESAHSLLRFSFNGALEARVDASVFTQLNQVLQAHVAGLSLTRTRIDDAIALIEESHGVVSIERAAEVFCRSRRQFERVFAETVGVSPKLFSQIARFQHAASSIAGLSTSLADVAAKAGYADQSHMTHQFKRFASSSPMQFMQNNVAFLQGLRPAGAEN
jgi:AraC-like DNA-binding protein